MPALTASHIAAAVAVVAAHAGVLWLLQAGLQNRPQDKVITAQVLVAGVTAPLPAYSQPALAPAPPVARPAPAPAAPAAGRAPAVPAPNAAPASTPVTLNSEPVTQINPAPATPQATTIMAPATPSGSHTAFNSHPFDNGILASSMPGPPSAPRVELPPTVASHLNNPPPRYPPLSRRLGEQGQVILRVRIETDGSASQAEVYASSGHARLDQAALTSALGWRYVPGTRNGVAEAMWFNIPIQFVLE